MHSPALRQFSDKGCLGGGLPVSFGLPTILSSVALIVGFLVCVEYNDTAATDAHVNQYYMWYIHVSFMIFVGFGFLMTFLRRYSYSAVALNMFTSALVVLEFIWIGGAIQQLWSKEHGSDIRKIQLNLPLMIDALFCAASGMIAFGAVLGKTTPTQLTLLLILFVPIYAVNQKLVFEYLKGLDIGGSLTIHVFGAYFGLVSSLVLGKRGTGAEHPKNGSSYTSDITSMIGTIFLFIYWPSFNGALASVSEEEGPVQTQFYCVINTITSLLGAIVVVFATSAIYEGKFNMMHIQNATLAGGVAMGAASNLKMQPGGALVIGTIAGILSTTGFQYISPFLEKTIGLTDTCGVHNLHGMPGILGGLAAAAVSGIAYNQNAEILEAYRGSHSWSYQLASLATTLGMAIVGGVVCSLIVKMVTPADQELHGSHAFEDSFWWMAVEDEDSEAKAVDHEIIALSASKHCAMTSQHAHQSLYATPTTAPMGSHHSGAHQTIMGSHHDAHNHVIMSSRNTASNHPPSSPPSNRP